MTKKFFSALTAVLFFVLINFSCAKTSAEVSSDFAQEILELVNIERENYGLKPLRLSEDLMRAADIRAKEITKKFSHTRPNGSRFVTALKSNYMYAGENIAAGQRSAEEVMKSWMDSPGHRENILNPNYKFLGAGYVYDYDSDYEHFWVQLFKG